MSFVFSLCSLFVLLFEPASVAASLNLYVATLSDASPRESEAGSGVRLAGSLWRAEGATAVFACTARYGDGASESLLLQWGPSSMTASADINHRCVQASSRVASYFNCPPSLTQSRRADTWAQALTP